MAKKTLPRLTGPELEIMKELWASKRLSAREVHERIAEGHGWAYSTTRTTLERMARKGLITKKAYHGIHLYEPEITRPAGLARLVSDFSARVLELDPAPVISLFAESEVLTPEEIGELRRLLDEMNGEEP